MDKNKPINRLNSEEKSSVINQIKEIYTFIKIKKFIRLVPEVRTNIAGALHDAKLKEDIAGIDGRITIINGLPKAAGEIKFGAAEHTARLILTAKQFDKSINFVINLRYSPGLIQKIEQHTDLKMEEIKRENEPEEIKEKEFSTMQWLIKECVKKRGVVPDIIWDKGAIGKEPMIRLFAKTSTEMIDKLKKIIELI